MEPETSERQQREQRMLAVAKIKHAATLPRMKDGRRPPMHPKGVSEGEQVNTNDEIDTPPPEVLPEAHTEPVLEDQMALGLSEDGEDATVATSRSSKRRLRLRPRSRGSKELKNGAVLSPTSSLLVPSDSSQDEAASPLVPLASPIPNLAALARSRPLRSPIPTIPEFTPYLPGTCPPTPNWPSLEDLRRGLFRSNSVGSTSVARAIAMHKLTGAETNDPSLSPPLLGQLRRNTVSGGERTAARLMFSPIGFRIVEEPADPEPWGSNGEEYTARSPTLIVPLLPTTFEPPPEPHLPPPSPSRAATPWWSLAEEGPPPLPPALARRRPTRQSLVEQEQKQPEQPRRRSAVVEDEDDERQLPFQPRKLPTPPQLSQLDYFENSLFSELSPSASPIQSSPTRSSPSRVASPPVPTAHSSRHPTPEYPSPFIVPLQEQTREDEEEEEEAVLYPADSYHPRNAYDNEFERRISWVASPVPDIRMPIDDDDDEQQEDDIVDDEGEEEQEYEQQPSPRSSTEFSPQEAYDDTSHRNSFESEGVMSEPEIITSQVPPSPSSVTVLSQSLSQPMSIVRAASDESTSSQRYPTTLSVVSRTQDRSPLNTEFDWEDAGKRNWDGASTSTSFRSGSTAGRRSRMNSIVTRDWRDHTDSSVSRESLTSAKTDKVEMARPLGNRPQQVMMMQPASASTSAVSLSPNTFPFPTASSAGPMKYQNAEFPFPGMQELQEQKNRAKGMLTPSASTPDISTLFDGYETDGGSPPSSYAHTPAQTHELRDRKLSHQASDTRLLDRYAMPTSPTNSTAPANIDYFNVPAPMSPSQSTGSTSSELPMTLPGVKQWLISRKKLSAPNNPTRERPSLSASKKPSLSDLVLRENSSLMRHWEIIPFSPSESMFGRGGDSLGRDWEDVEIIPLSASESMFGRGGDSGGMTPSPAPHTVPLTAPPSQNAFPQSAFLDTEKTPKDRIWQNVGFPDINTLIQDWAILTGHSPDVAKMCDICSVSRLLPFSQVPLQTPFSIQALDALESNIKYRLWFTGFVWYMAGEGATLVWETILSDASVFWLWEDEDEEYIKEFVQALPASHCIPLVVTDGALQALKAISLSQAMVASNLLAHLTPPTRLRIIAWLMAAGPVRKDRKFKDRGSPNIATLIHDWAKSIALSAEPAKMCNICSVSHLLPVWIETLSQIYSVENLKSLPWSGCKCLDSQLSVHPAHHRVILETNSPVLHMLYELVVPPWALIHWVTFRTGVPVVDEQADPLAPFLELICGPSADQDLFAWDEDENLRLWQWLQAGDITRPTLYPQDWYGYMVEIPFGTWLEISNITKTAVRPLLCGSDYISDLRIRLASVFLKYSCTALTFQKILAPFSISFEHAPFNFITWVVDLGHKLKEQHNNLGSIEFWSSTNLEKWLMTYRENLCRSFWNSSPPSSVVQQVQDILLIFETLPLNLTIYADHLRRRGLRSLNKNDWQSKSGLEFLVALSQYRADVKSLLGMVRQSAKTALTHTIAKDVCKHIYSDLWAVVARLVLFLRNQKSYKIFLACRGAEAQQLLDFLQDLLDLDSFSGIKSLIFQALRQLSRPSALHPRCFALSGLQRLGEQVTGGGFGDIWKGIVGGQTVCVKVMRIFGSSNIEAALKEFGLEATIWRQLSHPNVLPFFGLYYAKNRLCLISPWMEDGHIIDFLRNHEPTDTERLALILDVALGLQYLHEEKVVHGDLKGLNILVTPSHRACIADFGVSSIADSITVRFTHSTVTARAGTARYQAPELFRVENPVKIHYGSDVYAFACVCYEILTGEVPFRELQNDMAVMMKVATGYRPPRPTSSPEKVDNLWELLLCCWEGEVEKRPTASQVVERLRGALIGAEQMSTPFIADWDEKFTSKFRRSVQGEPLLPSVTQIERMLYGDKKAQACRECHADQEASNRNNERSLHRHWPRNPGDNRKRSQRSSISKIQNESNPGQGTRNVGDELSDHLASDVA